MLQFLPLLPSLLFLQSTFIVDALYVRVPVTVLDEQGRSIQGLTSDDFTLYDEGEPRDIANFLLDEAPVSVLFLLDASGSILDDLTEIRHATIRFAQHFSQEDQFAIVSFAGKTETLQTWTNKLSDLRKSLRKLERGYGTAMYDAILQTAREKLSRIEGKRVMILVTDALDNASFAGYEDAMQELTDLDVVLYIVSRTRLVRPKVAESKRVEFLDQVLKNLLDDDSSFVDIYFKEKEAALDNLAGVNAGRVFYPRRLDALAQNYADIARELKSQYLLTFRPPGHSEKRYRDIKVVCNQPFGRLYHRQVYRAP